MSAIVIFSGPSLPPAQVARQFPEAECLGPAARGDIYRACERRPRAICLIDGYFEHRPAVTHKEILWALAHAIPVYGAASLGALRAVELASHGMIGRGVVYQAFARGELEDEDEVAVPHGPGPEFRSGAEAMINLRATLHASVVAGVIDAQLCFELIEIAKSLFYADRSYERLLGEAVERFSNHHFVHARLVALKAWLSDAGHRVDQKQLDASALLSEVRTAWRSTSLPVIQTGWSFPETSSWRRWVAQWSADRSGTTQPIEPDAKISVRESASDRAIVEEVQLLGPQVYSEILGSAAVRALCVAIMRQPDESRSPTERKRPSVTEEEGFAQTERLVREVLPRAQELIRRQIPEVLRALGDYPQVRARAEMKRDICSSTEDSHRDASAIVMGYFERQLRRKMPEDLRAFAAEVGFASEEDFIRAVTREDAFVRWSKARERS